MSDLLSAEEIAQMNDYLREHPPLVGPPADLSFFDVRRIVRTLLHLHGRVQSLEGQAWATMCAMLRNERDDLKRRLEAQIVMRDLETDLKRDAWAEVERLSLALDRYGRHEESCINGQFEHTQEDCDCGLLAALGLPGPAILPPYAP